jgi:hypothetical protein
MRNLLFSKTFSGFLLFLFFLAIYALTLCPTVFWWDSGEFIANIAVLGIPHRPGFPIYILLGKLFSFLPFLNLALRVNFLSALFSASSLLVLYFAFLELLSMFFPKTEQRKTQTIISASASLLVLGFSYSFWIQAVRAEVYSLGLLFFALLLFLSLRYIRTLHPKYILLFFFIFGLGLGNHHLSLLSTAPALFFLLLGSKAHHRSVIPNRSSVISLRRLPVLVLFFLLGLSVYLYLPIRSSSNPVLAWGNTQSVSGSVSSVFALESLKDLNFHFLSHIGDKIFALVYLFHDQLTWLCFLISLLGMILLARRGRRILIFLLLLIAGNCASVVFMTTEFISTNPDLHGYLLSSLLSFAFMYGFGIFFIIDAVANRSATIRHLSFIVFLLISLIPLTKHVTHADLSNNRIAYDYGYNTIHHLDSNSVLLVDNVNLAFILRELQHGEGIRKDLKVIERGLLSSNWYAEQKRKEFKDLLSGIPDDFSGEVLFGAILRNSLDRNVSTYVEFTEKDSSLANHLVPSGYVFKLSRKRIDRIPDGILLRQKEWEKNEFLGLDDDDFRRDWDAQRVYALSLYRLGLFYERKGMLTCALEKFEQLKTIDPYNEELVGRMNELKKNQKLLGITDPNSALQPSTPTPLTR